MGFEFTCGHFLHGLLLMSMIIFWRSPEDNSTEKGKVHPFQTLIVCCEVHPDVWWDINDRPVRAAAGYGPTRRWPSTSRDGVQPPQAAKCKEPKSTTIE